ncbi:MAG: MFS transporter [Candidatus Wallbacteria bacterium]
MVNDLQQSLKNSIIDGSFAQSMSTLTGGLFLTGFVMAIGGNSYHIGVASSIPLFSNLFQLVASYLIERSGARKKICVTACMVARSMWFIFALLPILYIYRPELKEEILWAAIGVYALNALAAAFAGISWVSWMKDLVPAGQRGKYFGLRSTVTSISGLVVGFLFGRFLDAMKNFGTTYYLMAYFTLFLSAFICGALSTIYLKKVEEPEYLIPAGNEKPGLWAFIKMLILPFKNRQFRNAMLINAAFTFACNIASPFFNLYILRELEVSFTMMAIYDVINLMANISTFSVWGRLIDRLGNKPILLITTFFGAALPIIMVFATKENAWLLIPLFELTTGLVWSGINLATSNIFMKLAPSEHGSIYLSFNSALNGILSSLGPILGGYMAYRLKSEKLTLNFSYLLSPENAGYGFTFQIANLQFIFLISVLLRLTGSYLFKYVEEPESKPFKNVVRLLTHARGFALTTFNYALIYDYFNSGMEKITNIEDKVINRVKKLRGNLFTKKMNNSSINNGPADIKLKNTEIVKNEQINIEPLKNETTNNEITELKDSEIKTNEEKSSETSEIQK